MHSMSVVFLGPRTRCRTSWKSSDQDDVMWLPVTIVQQVNYNRRSLAMMSDRLGGVSSFLTAHQHNDIGC